MTTTLSIRINEKTKREARKTLALLGLDLSSAVNMFLTILQLVKMRRRCILITSKSFWMM
jgi:addiction module RelB/DinJ family antitoxin